jgi:hypothetical protein
MEEMKNSLVSLQSRWKSLPSSVRAQPCNNIFVSICSVLKQSTEIFYKKQQIKAIETQQQRQAETNKKLKIGTMTAVGGIIQATGFISVVGSMAVTALSSSLGAATVIAGLGCAYYYPEQTKKILTTGKSKVTACVERFGVFFKKTPSAPTVQTNRVGAALL